MRRTAEDSEKTRNKLIEVSIDVFAKKGYSATSLIDIANEAGLTRGAIYHHFKNKSELFAAISEQYHNKNIELLKNYLSKDMDAITKLKLGLKEYFRLVEDDLKVVEFQQMHLLKQEILSSNASMNFLKDELQKHFTAVENLIREGQQAKTITPDVNPQTFTFFLFSFINGILNMWISFGAPCSLQKAMDYVDEYIDMKLQI